MPKLAALLSSAALVAGGLVVVVGAPAQAECPYVACIDTDMHATASKTIKAGGKSRVCGEVSTSGNARPEGRLVFHGTGPGGYSKSTDLDYFGERACVSFKLKKPGKYKFRVTYEPAADSVYLGSRDSATTTVKKKK